MFKARWNDEVFQVGDCIIAFRYHKDRRTLDVLTNPVFHKDEYTGGTYWAVLGSYQLDKFFDYRSFLEAFWRELRSINLIDLKQMIERLVRDSRTNKQQN